MPELKDGPSVISLTTRVLHIRLTEPLLSKLLPKRFEEYHIDSLPLLRL
jgi:hypothetical protein